MGRGRKKLPQEVLDLRGTARKDRARPAGLAASAVAEIECWTAPGYNLLTDRGRKLYRKACRACISLKVLSVQDLPELVMYAQEFDTYLSAVEDIAANGLKYSTEDKLGNRHWATNPAVSVANASLRNVCSIGSNFGFSPVDRQKLRVQQGEDPMEKIKKVMLEVEYDNDGPDNQ